LDLFHKVYKTIDNLFTQDGLRHGDLWLPNICFNGRFDVVLIDQGFFQGGGGGGEHLPPLEFGLPPLEFGLPP